MAQTIYEVEGGRELRSTLRKAGSDLTELKTAHMAAASTVATRARGTAPMRTGRLAASVRPGATKTAALIRAGGARVVYAQPIHWGWRARNIVGQPWLSEAATDTQPQWEGAYVDAVDAALSHVRGA